MRNFDWIFNAECEVAECKDCVYDNSSSSDWDWYWNKPQVVTLAGYRPYYTDGTPDPKNDEVNEWCYIETNEYVRDECQLSLKYLFELEEAEEEEVLYDGRMYEVRGKYSTMKETKSMSLLTRMMSTCSLTMLTYRSGTT